MEGLHQQFFDTQCYAFLKPFNSPMDAIPITPLKREFNIGRDKSNDLVFNSPLVSKHHCRLVWDSDGNLLIDDVSTNGSIVNERDPVHKRSYMLSNEDEVVVAFENGERIGFEVVILKDAYMRQARKNRVLPSISGNEGPADDFDAGFSDEPFTVRVRKQMGEGKQDQKHDGRFKSIKDYVEEQDVQCPICFNLLMEPVTTACLHTFCGPCLSEWFYPMSDDIPEKKEWKCPICNQRIPTVARNTQGDMKVKAIDSVSKDHQAKSGDAAEALKEDDTRFGKINRFKTFDMVYLDEMYNSIVAEARAASEARAAARGGSRRGRGRGRASTGGSSRRGTTSGGGVGDVRVVAGTPRGRVPRGGSSRGGRGRANVVVPEIVLD